MKFKSISCLACLKSRMRNKMSYVRVPRSYKVFRYGEFYCVFPSRRETAEYMIEHHFWDIGLNNMYYNIISKYPKGGCANYHGFTFEKDPDWVPSKPVMAIDDETGEMFEKKSVREMGKVIFGDRDSYAANRITKLIKSQKKHRDLRFEYIPNGYVDCMSGANFTDRPVIGVNLGTGKVLYFSTLKKAAKYIKRTQLMDTDVGVVSQYFKLCM